MKETKIRTSNWYSFSVCDKCHKRLSDNVMMYSNATCPLCGYTCSGTICLTRKVTIRSLKRFNWWQLLGRVTTYEGIDAFSKDWLSK